MSASQKAWISFVLHLTRFSHGPRQIYLWRVQLVTSYCCDKIPEGTTWRRKSLLWLTVSGVSEQNWLHCFGPVMRQSISRIIMEEPGERTVGRDVRPTLRRHTSRCPLPWTRQALPGSFYHFPVKSFYYDSMNRLIHWADQGHWDIYQIRSSDSSCTSLHKKHSLYTPVLYGTNMNTNMFKPPVSALSLFSWV